MKKIFFILLFFMLSLPSFGADYIQDEFKKCRLWDNNPSKDTAAVWIGGINNNDFCSGFGLLIWVKKDNFQVGYLGELNKFGKFNDKVKSFDLRDNYKIGNWSNGEKPKKWSLATSKKKKLIEKDIKNELEIIIKSIKKEAIINSMKDNDGYYNHNDPDFLIEEFMKNLYLKIIANKFGIKISAE